MIDEYPISGKMWMLNLNNRPFAKKNTVCSACFALKMVNLSLESA
ncbi:hypothetical protein [Emergencia timonensis]|nr:hypothetical protein [Emergencia timonensis]